MFTQFIIFSVFREKDSYDVNYNNDQVTRKRLKQLGIDYVVLDGCYNGVTESSLMVDAKHENIVMKIASIFDQESILFVDKKRNACLTFLDTERTIKLDGKFKEVSREEAILAECFSRNAYSNKYYTVK